MLGQNNHLVHLFYLRYMRNLDYASCSNRGLILHFEPPLNSLRIESGIDVFTIDDDKGIELKANRRIVIKRTDYTAPTPMKRVMIFILFIILI